MIACLPSFMILTLTLDPFASNLSSKAFLISVFVESLRTTNSSLLPSLRSCWGVPDMAFIVFSVTYGCRMIVRLICASLRLSGERTQSQALAFQALPQAQ